jgi:acyl-CoA thioesterase FadM
MTTVQVMIDPGTLRARRIPEDLRATLENAKEVEGARPSR